VSRRIWVTRSQPGADRQAAELQDAGFDAVAAPVLGIEPLPAEPPAGPFDYVIFLSEQAVRCTDALDYCRDAKVYAVGERTAEALREHGVETQVPDRAASEGILEMLDAPAGARILLVAGEDGRKLLRDELTRAGAQVVEHLCYRRVGLRVSREAMEGVTTILVASQDGFRQVARLWFEHGGDSAVEVLTASERIAGIGPELGFSRVRSVGGAATGDWLEGLAGEPREKD
jgi:uroporphyrinogen-III synthase